MNKEKEEGYSEAYKEGKPENRGTASRNRDYKETYRRTGDHKAAIRSWCAGNVWATENAKAVGNWD